MTVMAENRKVASSIASIPENSTAIVNNSVSHRSSNRDFEESASNNHHQQYQQETSNNSNNSNNNNNTMPICTGLSALIQAATSQLGHLVDAEFGASDASSQVSHHSSHADGYASSSDGDAGAFGAAATATTGVLSSPPTRNPTTEDGNLSLPEILMTLLINPDYSDIITFLPDGKFFALRQQEFSEHLLPRHFSNIGSFDDFLNVMQSWGFTRITAEDADDVPQPSAAEAAAPPTEAADNSSSSIQVFRHPHFRKGAHKDLRQVRFGQYPPEASMGTATAPPSSSTEQQTKVIEKTCSEDSGSSSTKRRLSPSHISRDAEDLSLKQRAVEDTTAAAAATASVAADYDRTPSSLGSASNDSDHHHQQQPIRTIARRRSSIEARSYALAVTTAKLNIGGGPGDDSERTTATNQGEYEQQQQQQQYNNSSSSNSNNKATAMPLEEGAVERVTQSIVTDAIESLLFDVGHTRETYLKHEKELSTSAFPGVVPISKQLFSSAQAQTDEQALLLQQQQQQLQNGATMPPYKDDSSKENDNHDRHRDTAGPSPTQIEAATALMKQAGKFDPPPFARRTS